MKFELAPDATPLDADSASGLIPNLTTQAELNEFEERNIIAATLWSRRSTALRRDFPNVSALLLLHRRMFDKTWRWAGKFRHHDTNIGIDWRHISAELHNLCENTRVQVHHSAYPWDELAARFHHELVSIHPFPNGNGRHARLATDILLRQHGQTAVTWGGGSLIAPNQLRSRYIAALQQADAGRYEPLIAFIRS